MDAATSSFPAQHRHSWKFSQGTLGTLLTVHLLQTPSVLSRSLSSGMGAMSQGSSDTEVGKAPTKHRTTFRGAVSLKTRPISPVGISRAHSMLRLCESGFLVSS